MPGVSLRVESPVIWSRISPSSWTGALVLGISPNFVVRLLGVIYIKVPFLSAVAG